jgi:hypothetical protein
MKLQKSKNKERSTEEIICTNSEEDRQGYILKRSWAKREGKQKQKHGKLWLGKRS